MESFVSGSHWQPNSSESITDAEKKVSVAGIE
jgi:hypothetical protein